MAQAYVFSDTTGCINLASIRESVQHSIGNMAVGLYPASSNTCVVEVTIEPDPTVAGAVWHAWDEGAVTEATLSGMFAYPTGIRARRTVGSNSGNRLILHPA